MCIVVIKDMGVQYPDRQKIVNCCENNPDGFSIAWSCEGKMHTFKSMSQKTFMRKYDEIVSKYPAESTSFILHARIATHGSKSLKNCHCWTGGEFAFAHNGILSVDNRGDMTDSETFFRDVFLPVYKCGGWSAATRAVNCIIGHSKFAFLNKDGRIWHFGDYEKDSGLLWSNHTFAYGAWRPKYYGSTYQGYCGLEDKWGDDLPLSSNDSKFWEKFYKEF